MNFVHVLVLGKRKIVTELLAGVLIQIQRRCRRQGAEVSGILAGFTSHVHTRLESSRQACCQGHLQATLPFLLTTPCAAAANCPRKCTCSGREYACSESSFCCNLHLHCCGQTSRCLLVQSPLCHAIRSSRHSRQFTNLVSYCLLVADQWLPQVQWRRAEGLRGGAHGRIHQSGKANCPGLSARGRGQGAGKQGQETRDPAAYGLGVKAFR